jgi:hypothetical protein
MSRLSLALLLDGVDEDVEGLTKLIRRAADNWANCEFTDTEELLMESNAVTIAIPRD